jgi:GntR family transcriptional regulator
MTERPSLESGRPRHEQVSDWILAQIESGRYAVDDRLPSESELQELFGVSRITVRRGLATLESDGRIYRQQGLGSFVAPARITQGLVRLTDFAEDMRLAGLEARSRVLLQRREPASAVVARLLGVNEGDPIERLDRLRTGDGRPVAMDRTWLPPYYAQLLAGRDLEADTIYSILEGVGIPVLRGRYRIQAVLAHDAEAIPLDVGRGAPLLRIDRTSFTLAGRVVYHQARYYRTDRVAFDLEAARDDRAGSADMRLEGLEPVFNPAPADPPDASS